MIYSEKQYKILEEQLRKSKKEIELKDKENKILKQQNRQKDEIIYDLDKNQYKEKYTIIYSKDIKDIEELSNYPIILPTSDRNERLNITNLLKSINIKDNLSIEVNDFYSMIEYVKEGVGYAIVPKRLVSDDLKTFDIDYEKEVSIYYINDYLSPTAKVFIEEIKNNS